MYYSFLAFIFRQKYIKRWSLMRNTSDENLSTHAYECSLITHMLCTIGNKLYNKNYNTEKAVLCALYHDVPEVLTGDLPTPVKYFNTLSKNSYKEVENNAINCILEKLPFELRDEYRPLIKNEDQDIEKIVKIADKLCAYIKCQEELKCGNYEFKEAMISTKKALQSYDSDELKWFMDNMSEAFDKSLDQL